MIISKKNNIVENLFSLVILFSSLVVLQFHGKTMFIILQILLCGAVFLYSGKVCFFKKSIINVIYINFFFSIISALLGNMYPSYKKAAVVMVIFLFPTYFIAAYLDQKRNLKISYVELFVKAFKLMCLIQLFWVVVQFVLYKGLRIDINKLIFVDTLHLLNKASFIRSWVYYPSGLTWHSAILAPMFVMAFVFFKNPLIRLLIIVDAIICGNSTSLIGVVLCICILVFIQLRDNRIKSLVKANSKIVAALIVVAAGAVVLMAATDFGEYIVSRIQYLFERFSSSDDESTAAHLSYYIECYDTMKEKLIGPDPGKKNILQFLFGYGYGCSGFIITDKYNRFLSFGNWSIECDFVDIMISRGIVGFITYYLFLFEIFRKGIKIDKRYAAVIVPIVIEGLGYNVQWDYLFFIEVFMYITIRHNINIFEFSDEKDMVVKIKKIFTGIN